MSNPSELRAQAAHWRELARHIIDDLVQARIIEFARECEQQAAEIDAREIKAKG